MGSPADNRTDLQRSKVRRERRARSLLSRSAQLMGTRASLNPQWMALAGEKSLDVGGPFATAIDARHGHRGELIDVETSGHQISLGREPQLAGQQ